MNYLELIKKYGGGLYYDRVTGKVNVEGTAYGAIIERFEDDKFDIQMTCCGIKNLDKVLKKITNDENNC